MGRAVENPCIHIVSFRVSEKELDKLTRWTDETGMGLSTMLRKIINDVDTFSVGADTGHWLKRG